jgi:hypothetical protein
MAAWALAKIADESLVAAGNPGMQESEVCDRNL